MKKVERWYAGFSYKGNAKQLVEQISKKVLEHTLSNFVPLVRIEKGAKRQTFYFFLACESPQPGQLPQEVQSYLMPLPFFKFPIKGSKGRLSFSYEEIKPMVGAAHDVHDYTNPIPYQVAEQDLYDDPFDIGKSSLNYHTNPNIEILSSRFEQLLYWLSAVGSGTWESFKKACQALELENPGRILRRLKLLGHMESSPDGTRWSIAPTALVQIESQSENQEFILCGQQNGDLLRELKQYATIGFTNQLRGNGPPCISIQLTGLASVEDVIEQIRNCLGLNIYNAGNAAKRLADVLPDLKEWKLGLRCLQGIVPSLYKWKRFNGDEFIECVFPNQTGMYEIWDLNVGESQVEKLGDRPRHTLFYDQESNCWLQGDWYGLRFLALQHRGQECIARYDSATKRLAVSVSQRWPEIYERALVLASGQLPTYQGSWLLYEKVGLEVVRQLTDKLNIKLEEVLTYA